MKNQTETQKRQLTSNQKEFILETFFKNEKYAGWRNVAEKLLEKGECIVAGKTRIWIGGIENFIEMEDAKDAIDCSLYKFDLEYFLTSQWYKDISIQKKILLSDEISKLQDELYDICRL